MRVLTDARASCVAEESISPATGRPRRFGKSKGDAIETATCERCGHSFERIVRAPGAQHFQRFCSRLCASKARQRPPSIVLSEASAHLQQHPTVQTGACTHYWLIDGFQHGKCQKCKADKDFSTIGQRYRGLFVHQGGRE